MEKYKYFIDVDGDHYFSNSRNAYKLLVEYDATRVTVYDWHGRKLCTAYRLDGVILRGAYRK